MTIPSRWIPRAMLGVMLIAIIFNTVDEATILRMSSTESTGGQLLGAAIGLALLALVLIVTIAAYQHLRQNGEIDRDKRTLWTVGIWALMPFGGFFYYLAHARGRKAQFS